MRITMVMRVMSVVMRIMVKPITVMAMMIRG